MIGDFPFVDQASYANAVGAMITAVCRHIIGGPVPLALFDATTQGTGKTLLAEVIALILTGRAAELMSPPAEPEEWRKQLTSILIEAPPLVIIDNVASVADWPGFCKVITGEMHRDRLLGKSQTVSVAVRCSWIITGNNLQLAGDMARRCYWIRMDAGCSDPFLRTGFKHERLKEYVLHRRRELLIALLTIARAWFAAGQPKASTPLVGSFERWTEVIAGILQHAQVDGFLTNSDRLFEQSDVERSDWETFVEVTEDAFPGMAFSVAEFWERLNEKSYEELIRQSVLTDRAEELRNALPADLTRWMDREGPFKQRLGVAFIVKQLGRGISETTIPNGEDIDAALLAKIRTEEEPEVDAFEAQKVIDQLATCDVDDVVPAGDSFRVVLRVLGGDGHAPPQDAVREGREPVPARLCPRAGPAVQPAGARPSTCARPAISTRSSRTRPRGTSGTCLSSTRPSWSKPPSTLSTPPSRRTGTQIFSRGVAGESLPPLPRPLGTPAR